MDCPACQTKNPPEQKFCGACGHMLEASCARCGVPNPTHYKFCGQCGASLSLAGIITLAPSGLITRINQKALDLLGHNKSDMLGKPFSLFVEREDLVIFFSHLNELHGAAGQQAFEIRLKHARKKSIYTALDCRVDKEASQGADHIQIVLDEVGDHRLASAQMQYQQDLLGLVFSISDSISAVSRKHLGIALEDALKKICLFAKADLSFIYSINNQAKVLKPAYHWCQPSSSAADCPRFRSVPLAIIKRTIVKMRREQRYVIHDTAQLTPAERYELLAWHQTELGAIMCQLIYSAKRPIGLIGLAKNKADGEWAAECVSLVKFMGQVAADKLQMSQVDDGPIEQPPPEAAATAKPGPAAESRPTGKVIDINAKMPPSITPAHKPSGRRGAKPSNRLPTRPDTTRPMLLTNLSHRRAEDQQPVFPQDNGLVLLTCPRCGLQESVTIDQFSRLGNAVGVHCQCRKHFSAVLEKRRSFRKTVQLEGYFSLKGDLGPVGADGSIWGPMVVKDLSKSGLRFACDKADFIKSGDLLLVRFNLDNSNRALIHKPARVVSVTRDEVGCLFEGSDSYDITLGFYFI